MRAFILFLCLAFVVAGAAWANDPAPQLSSEKIERLIKKLDEDVDENRQIIKDLKKRVDVLEQRVGDSYRPVSPFDTVERRLDDMKRDIDSLKRSTR